MSETGQSGPGTEPPAGSVDWAARWVGKFQVYPQRRFGAGSAVTPRQVGDFVRFMAVRWQAPEWQRNQAEAALRKHYGHWLRQYWAFLQTRKRQSGFADLAPAAKAKAFLEYLAVERQVAAATQNQGLPGSDPSKSMHLKML